MCSLISLTIHLKVCNSYVSFHKLQNEAVEAKTLSVKLGCMLLIMHSTFLFVRESL